MDELELKNKSEKELEQMKKEITDEYYFEKNHIKNEYIKEIRELKEEYNYRLIEIDNPLKAERYRKRIEKRNQNRIINEAPKRRLIEEIGNSITHGIGALIGIVLLILMLRYSNSAVEVVSAAIYGFCLILQMAFSSMYHAFRYGSRVKRIFR